MDDMDPIEQIRCQAPMVFFCFLRSCALYHAETQRVIWSTHDQRITAWTFDAERVYLMVNGCLEIMNLKTGEAELHREAFTYGWKRLLNFRKVTNIIVDEQFLYLLLDTDLWVFDKVSMAHRYEIQGLEGMESADLEISGPFIYLMASHEVQIRNKYSGEQVHQWRLPNFGPKEELIAFHISSHSRKMYLETTEKIFSFS
jgi:hypothetical protein